MNWLNAVKCFAYDIQRVSIVSTKMAGQDTLKHRPPYADSMTGGTASWFLFTDLRQYRDDELCDAG